jgi:hypothetical protein
MTRSAFEAALKFSHSPEEAVNSRQQRALLNRAAGFRFVPAAIRLKLNAGDAPILCTMCTN